MGGPTGCRRDRKFEVFMRSIALIIPTHRLVKGVIVTGSSTTTAFKGQPQRRCQSTQPINKNNMKQPRRLFLIPFSTVPSRAPANKAFDGACRADVLCRCVVNCLMASAATRNDSCIACVLLGPGAAAVEPATLLCCGQHMRALHPTEKTVAGIVQRALPPAPGHPGDLQELAAQGLLNCYTGKRSCCQGTWLHPGGTAAALAHLLTPSVGGSNPVILILQEGAEPISTVLASCMAAADGDTGPSPGPPPTSIITVLGDDAGLTPEQRADLVSTAQRTGVRLLQASLGPMQLLASQCITLVHHYLDLLLGPSDTQKPKHDPANPWPDDRMRPCHICYPPGFLEGGAQQQQQQQQQQAPPEQQQ